MGFDGVALETDGAIARIRLARPEKRNAMSLDMLEALQQTLETVPPSAGAVILEAEGPVFSAGHDLGEMIDRPNYFYAALFGACTDMMESLHRISQPVIAKVQGPATAAGCQLVASSDLPATTHWGALGLLGDLGTDVTVRPDDRFVDDGSIVTAAGVSAGIDMALHLVARLHSPERAREVRRYIQYDPEPPV
jgi:1,4-dihydroxy-2-naphthoyl-CoA synthase